MMCYQFCLMVKTWKTINMLYLKHPKTKLFHLNGSFIENLWGCTNFSQHCVNFQYTELGTHAPKCSQHLYHCKGWNRCDTLSFLLRCCVCVYVRWIFHRSHEIDINIKNFLTDVLGTTVSFQKQIASKS